MCRKTKSNAMQEQIKRLRNQGHSIRSISLALGIHRHTVRKHLPNGDDHKIDVPVRDEDKPLLNLPWDKIHEEVSLGVPLKILFQEIQPECDYVTFWRAYRRLKPLSPKVTMRLDHKPGEKTQIDYCDGIPIYDRFSGEKTETQFFCGVLPFSHYIYGEFSLNQKLPSFIESQERMFQYFEGVTPYAVIDNLKSGVSKAHLYDPDVNPTYCDFANHMGFAVLPARPAHPQDKAGIESAIGIVQRSFFTLVRNRKFYSLTELNRCFWEFLVKLNNSVMKDYGVTRKDRYLKEKHLLKPLPTSRFEISEWKSAKVHPDCHVQIQHNFYSVPFRYVGQTVRVRITNRMIEVFEQEGEAITVHPRQKGKHQRHTINEHYPEEKVALVYFDIAQAKKEAFAIGENTVKLVTHLFEKQRPLRFLRRVQGILRLVKSHRVSKEALDFACGMALKFNKPRMDYIKGCAMHFDKNGNQPFLSTPKRDNENIYLHQPQRKENLCF